jgi:hypothetical protein
MMGKVLNAYGRKEFDSNDKVDEAISQKLRQFFRTDKEE